MFPQSSRHLSRQAAAKCPCPCSVAGTGEPSHSPAGSQGSLHILGGAVGTPRRAGTASGVMERGEVGLGMGFWVWLLVLLPLLSPFLGMLSAIQLYSH